MSKTEVSLLVTLAGHEREWERVVIEYRYIKASRGLFEKGGGQITPDEPAQVEILSVKVIDGDKRHEIPDWLLEPFSEAIEAACFEDVEAEADDAADRRAEARAEARAEGLAEERRERAAGVREPVGDDEEGE